MGGFYRKKSGMSAGRERPRIEWEDYIGRKVECLKEGKGQGSNGRIIEEEKWNVCRKGKA